MGIMRWMAVFIVLASWAEDSVAGVQPQGMLRDSSPLTAFCMSGGVAGRDGSTLKRGHMPHMVPRHGGMCEIVRPSRISLLRRAPEKVTPARRMSSEGGSSEGVGEERSQDEGKDDTPIPQPGLHPGRRKRRSYFPFGMIMVLWKKYYR